MKTRRKTIFITIIILVPVLFFSVSVLAASLKIGSGVTPVSLSSVDGSQKNLGNSLGKKTTVIWISDLCPVCASGVDNFQKLSITHSQQADFYLISTVNREVTSSFLEKNRISATVLLGGSDPLTRQLTGKSSYGLCPVENIYFIDRHGILKHRGHLPGVTNREMERILSGL